ncbi:hypothetical protein FQR65_LT20135 [Abscondita terminalis]|nr:hypothetical protein FQR65_LT20135 [Abscondita terminalis]
MQIIASGGLPSSFLTAVSRRFSSIAGSALGLKLTLEQQCGARANAGCGSATKRVAPAFDNCNKAPGGDPTVPMPIWEYRARPRIVNPAGAAKPWRRRYAARAPPCLGLGRHDRQRAAWPSGRTPKVSLPAPGN